MATKVISGGGVQSHLFCVQTTGGDEPKPWPFRWTIKARCLDSVHPVVRDALGYAAVEWLKSQMALSKSTQEVNIEWVDGNADVRFAMDGGTTRCALGADARSIPQEKPTAVLGLKKWKAAESEYVWNLVEVDRLARHVWGHILGLPHAYNEGGRWDTSQVEKLCDADGIAKVQVLNRLGSIKLNSSLSIMHFDRPANLTSRPALYSSNTGIDSLSIKVVRELYPEPRDVDLIQASVTEFPGFKRDSFSDQKMYIKTVPVKTNAWSRIAALNLLDLGTNGKYQASAIPYASEVGSQAIKLHMGAWETNVHVIDIKAMFLCFDSADSRVRTGFVDTAGLRGDDWNNAAPGEQFKKRVDFGSSFKSKPNVVAFIFRFSLDRNTWIRMAVYPKDIDEKGFTLHMETWADTKAYDISVYWLAHEADEPTIRSGRWYPGEHVPTWATEDRAMVKFSSPLPARPRYLFCGFDHANVRNSVNARFRCDAMSWDKDGVDLRISAWITESAYHSMGASYIAIM